MHVDDYIKLVPRRLSELSYLSAADSQLVERTLFQDHLLDTFSVCSSFSERVREQVIPRLLLPQTTVLGGLLACAISWEGDVDGQANQGRLRTCYQHASSALAALASFHVTDFQAMIDCLMLGSLVSTFAVRLRLNDILAICSRTLALIQPVYNTSDPSRPELRVFLSCMVMWELRGCLFSCAVPTLRFRPPAEAYADRHVGLCGTLLPLFYDVCKLSHALAYDNSDNDTILMGLDVIELSAREWQPAVPENFTTRFSAIEVSHMLCQVHAMRAAALLVIHRLRYPFGLHNEPARALSLAILAQLEVTFAATKEAVRCIDLALMIACLELQGLERRKWLLNISRYAGFSPKYGKHMQDTLTSFWAAMDSSKTISWSDLATAGFPFLRNPE